MELYYKNDNVIVSNDFYGYDLLVISFCPLVDEKQAPTEDNGFGKAFFMSRNISCIYIIPTWNHWYQYEYIKEAIDIIRLVSKTFKKVVLYGVSMGGYAVLKYANYLNASDVISVSPQGAITSPQADFDKRFSKFWDKIEFKSDSWLEEDLPLNTTVFYDKYHYQDNKHAEIISRNIKHSKMIGLPFSGHEVFAVLNEAKILSDFIFALISPNTDYQSLLLIYKKNRHKSGVPWMYAAQNSYNRGRTNTAGKLYRKSIEVIEWRKASGLNIDQAKARMTLMEYVEYCFKENRLEEFFEVYKRFSDNKIIKIDLNEKYLESCLIRNDREGFLTAFGKLKSSGKFRSSIAKSMVADAIAKKLVMGTDLD